MWNDFLPLLGEKEEVISIDLPGFGKEPLNAEIETLEDMADWVHSRLSLHEGPIIWVGHSMGGYIGVEFAVKYPERLSGLVMFHSSFTADTEEKKLQRRKAMSFVKRSGINGFLRQFVPKLFSTHQKTNKSLLSRAHKMVGSTSEAAMLMASAAMMNRRDHLGWLQEQSSIAVCMLIGKYDAHLPLKSQLAQAACIKNGSVVMLTASGHLGMWEEPEESASALINFSRSHCSA